MARRLTLIPAVVVSMALALLPATPAFAVSAPGAPTLSTVSVGASQVSVAFTAPSSNGGSAITGYTVSCTPIGSAAVTNTGASSPIVVTGLTNGTSYTCKVKATNSIGDSAWSASLVATPRTVPDAPTIGSATPGPNQVVLAFTAGASNGGAPVSTYKASCSAAGQTTRPGSASSSPITVGTLTNGTAYTCSVRAHNPAGDSAASGTEVSTPQPVLTAPTLSAANPGDQQLSVAFAAPGSNGVSVITGYTVSCTPSGGAAVTNTGASSPIVLTGLVNGTSYVCKARATNSEGDGPWSVTKSGTPRTLPDAPTIATVTAGNNQLAFGITAGGTGGSSISAYTVSCDDGSNPAKTGSASSTTVVVKNLTNGTAYICSATATNAAGSSVPSTDESGTPADVAPVPTIAATTAGSNQLTVSFTAGAANGSSTVTGFTATCTPASGPAITAFRASSPIVVTGLTNGTAYSCTVYANTATGVSTESGSLSATPRTVPGAPTAAVLTASNAQISVAFTAPTSNGGSSITSYSATCTPTSGTAVSASGSSSPLVVTGLINGTTYSCTVKAANAAGISPLSSSASTTPRTVPGAPTLGAVTAGNTQITVGFTAPSSTGGSTITGYTATCTPASGPVATVSGGTSPLTLTSLTNGTAYSCVVRATNTIGNSASSATASATPRTVPGAPTIGAATAASTQLSVAFTAPASTGGSSITAYTLTCTGTNGTSKVVTGTVSPIIATGLVNGVTHTCSVKASNSIGASAASSTVTGTPRTIPGVPAISVITIGNEQVSVAFTAPTSNGGSAVTSYVTSCQPASGSPTTGSSVTSPILLTGLVNGGIYSCTVTAANVAGTSAASRAMTATPRTVPGAPSISSVTPSNGQASVVFTAPGTNGGSTVTGYVVRCTPASGAAQTTSGSASPLVVRGLTNGTSYDCTATASNAVGASTASTGSAVTPRTTPGAPTGLALTPGNDQLSVAFTAPVSSGGSTITGYTAACTPTGGSALTNTGSTSPIVVTGLTNGTVYSCSVKATNVAGDSTLSSTASSTPRTTPGSPTIGAATPSSTQVSVAFTAPGSNGGSTVTGYTMSCLPGSGSAITNTGSVSPIIVTGLTNGTAYDCSVTATNVAGTSSASSSVSVTPRTTPGAPTSVTTTAGNTQITVGFTAPVSTGGSSITGYTATCTPASGTAHSATGSSSPLVVTSLTNGTSYTCTAKATNAAGDSSSASGSARTPFTVPGSPTIGTTTPYAGQISVAFTAPVSTGGSSITAYTVSCDDGSNPAVTATGASSPILVSSLENGLAYACSVVATNAAGSSAASSVSSATPRTTPGAPTLDSLTAGNGQIEVAFTAPVADGGNTISGYTASCVSSGSPAVTSTGVSSPIMITGLTNGTSYTCSVAAANVVGASASSGTNSETPVSVPDAPALDSVTRGDGTLDVAFTAASDQGSAITGYTVTCDDGSSPQTGSDTGSPITVTGLTNGTSYDCSVVATNAVGDSNASSTQSGTPRTVPDAPSISGIQVSDAALAVSFADAAFDGGATVTGYTVTCDDGVNPAITTTGSTSPINVTGLTNGTQFTCTVLSTNEAGDSTSSAGDFGTPYTTPDAAGIDSITPGDHHLIVAYTDNGNGGAGITGHTVSCTDGSSTHTSTASSPATVTALTNGTSYTCSVVATNAAGDSSASATGTATPATIPGAPAVTGVSKSGANEVTVTFTAPSSNGGSAITGYTAYCVSATASTQSSSAGSVQPITVTGLESGNSYWCFVVATNSMGGSVTVTEP